ncbi:MAG: type II toxin-antitoxin system RelE/ParE family toxin [Acholeplasmatales bacterium]|nr:type II toxin-antitoxin system RelE/ParE family toxin [Acholeplasmatales bacterium]
MGYKTVRTDKFNDQLIDIIMYIRDAFSKKEAVDYLDYLESIINNLKDFPYVGVVPRYQAIAKQGYRAIICKQNILFYKVKEDFKEIILSIIVSSKRNYINLV